jgi:hypothetical protein
MNISTKRVIKLLILGIFCSTIAFICINLFQEDEYEEFIEVKLPLNLNEYIFDEKKNKQFLHQYI